MEMVRVLASLCQLAPAGIKESEAVTLCHPRIPQGTGLDMVRVLAYLCLLAPGGMKGMNHGNGLRVLASGCFENNFSIRIKAVLKQNHLGALGGD